MQIADFFGTLFHAMPAYAINIIIVTGYGFTPLVLMPLTNLHTTP
jgi:hypothetical protein